MKRLLCTLLALLTLCGCSQPSAPAESAVSSAPKQEEAFTPVTSEEEVRALYGEEAQYITEIRPYEGDFLVYLDNNYNFPRLDWVYGKSGIRRELLGLTEGVADIEIIHAGAVQVRTDGILWVNGHQTFPHCETAELGPQFDEFGRPRPYGEGYPSSAGREEYWAPIDESHRFGMKGRREAVRSAQLEFSGLAIAFAPLADGSDFSAAYCAPPDTEVTYDKAARTVTITCRNSFLDSGELAEGMTEEMLAQQGSLYPNDFPAGPLAGSCPLIPSAEIAQEGETVVVRLALAEITEEVQYTVETGYEGPWDNGPYFRLKLRKVY